MQLIARGQPLEARHFGYGVLQHVVAKRWSQFTQPERQELAKLVYDKLSECGAVPADEPPEPFMIKSKVATLMAQVVRQEGVGMWSSIMPEMAAGALRVPRAGGALGAGDAVRRRGRGGVQLGHTRGTDEGVAVRADVHPAPGAAGDVSTSRGE